MAIRRINCASRQRLARILNLCDQRHEYCQPRAELHQSSLHFNIEVNSNEPRDKKTIESSDKDQTSFRHSTTPFSLPHCTNTRHSICKIRSPFHSIRTIQTSASGLPAMSQPLQSSRRGQLSSLEDARHYVASLSVYQRSTLEEALQEVRVDVGKLEDTAEDDKVDAPTRDQLKLLCYQAALPFIGFGFLDNVIMITVGEYIDWTLGVTLGISTMAAAGIGNMISDLAGLGLADQVEAICLRLGIPNPNLSTAQLRHKSARWTSLFGRCVGIVIGCTIGMAPLYWIKNPRDEISPEQGDDN